MTVSAMIVTIMVAAMAIGAPMVAIVFAIAIVMTIAASVIRTPDMHPGERRSDINAAMTDANAGERRAHIDALLADADMRERRVDVDTGLGAQAYAQQKHAGDGGQPSVQSAR